MNMSKKLEHVLWDNFSINAGYDNINNSNVYCWIVSWG